MKRIDIDGRSFEQEDSGLYVPNDPVRPVDELEWFHRFNDQLQAVVVQEECPGLVVPVQIDIGDDRKKDIRTEPVCGESRLWRYIGRAASYWHYDEAPNTPNPHFRASVFVLLNQGPGNDRRETLMTRDKLAIEAVQAMNMDQIDSRMWVDVEFLRGLVLRRAGWSGIIDEEALMLNVFRRSPEVKEFFNKAIDEVALRFPWTDHPNTVLYANNLHWIHRGNYLPEDEEAPVGFLYRTIID